MVLSNSAACPATSDLVLGVRQRTPLPLLEYAPPLSTTRLSRSRCSHSRLHRALRFALLLSVLLQLHASLSVFVALRQHCLSLSLSLSSSREVRTFSSPLPSRLHARNSKYSYYVWSRRLSCAHYLCRARSQSALLVQRPFPSRRSSRAPTTFSLSLFARWPTPDSRLAPAVSITSRFPRHRRRPGTWLQPSARLSLSIPRCHPLPRRRRPSLFVPRRNAVTIIPRLCSFLSSPLGRTRRLPDNFRLSAQRLGTATAQPAPRTRISTCDRQW